MATEPIHVRTLETGCNCNGDCPGLIPKDKCLYFQARTRGPISLKECPCVEGGRTYHDRDGLCLICRGVCRAIEQRRERVSASDG